MYKLPDKILPLTYIVIARLTRHAPLHVGLCLKHITIYMHNPLTCVGYSRLLIVACIGCGKRNAPNVE